MSDDSDKCPKCGSHDTTHTDGDSNHVTRLCVDCGDMFQVFPDDTKLPDGINRDVLFRLTQKIHMQRIELRRMNLEDQRLRRENADLRQRLEAAEKLLPFSWHAPSCHIITASYLVPFPRCTCGLYAIRAAIAQNGGGA